MVVLASRGVKRVRLDRGVIRNHPHGASLQCFAATVLGYGHETARQRIRRVAGKAWARAETIAPQIQPGTGQNPTIALFARIDKLHEIGPAIEPGSLRGDEPRPASLCSRLESSQPETWWPGRSYRLGRGCNQAGW